MPIFRGVPAASEFQDTTVNELEELIEQEAEARQAGDAALQSNIDSEVSTRQSADTTLQSNIDLKADKANPVFTGTFDVQSSNGAYIDLNDAAVSGTVESGLRLLRSGNNNDFEVLNTGAALTFSSGADVITSPTERMRLTSDGNLAIGSTIALAKLDVSSVNLPALRLSTSDGSESAVMEIGQDGLDPVFSAINQRSFVFNTDNTERMRLTRQGYLKADPSGSYGGGGSLTASSDHLFFNNRSNAVTLGAINSNPDVTGSVNIDSRFTPSSSQNLHYRALSNSSTVFSVAGDGTVSNVNGVIAAGSDIKLKENITDATPKLDDITALRFVNFDLKDNPDLGKQFGVIAQEIEEVFPNLVINTPDTEEVETTDEEGNTVTETVETGTVTKSVKYSVLTLMAVKALQELKAEKDELETKHEQLIDEVDILRQRIEALESN